MKRMTDLEVDAIVREFRERGEIPNNDQAMALVKKLKLALGAYGDGFEEWNVSTSEIFLNGYVSADNKDLNRAIVECVAKMQAGA